MFPYFEKRYLFYPALSGYETPSDYGCAYDNIYFKSPDGLRLNGWHLPHGEAHSAILFFQGNNGNMSCRTEFLARLNRDLRFDVFSFDYRGYGHSEGSPDEKGLYLDGIAAVRELRRRTQGRNLHIVLFGRALGAAVALETALHSPCDALIIESPFTRLKDIARKTFPFLISRHLITMKFDNLAKIRKTSLPILFLHGENDTITGPAHSARLHSRVKSAGRLHIVNNGGHDSLYIAGGPEYFCEIIKFCNTIHSMSGNDDDREFQNHD